MSLMLTLDDAMKVLLKGGYLDEGYIDNDGTASLVRQELEQKCYFCKEEEWKKDYKAVVVCLVPDDGILFAKRADSPAEASQIVFDDMLRIMDDYECKLEVSNFRDSYGEWCTEVKCEVGTYMYKVCFDDEERTKGGEDKCTKTK